MLMLSSASCSQDPTPAIDSCSWVKPITLTRPMVRGSQAFTGLSDDDRLALFEAERDIVTQVTAGQIVAHNRAVQRFCVGKPEKDASTIVGEIVTTDNSGVERYEVDRSAGVAAPVR